MCPDISSTRDIQGHLEDLYGTEVSPTLISAITDAVLDEVRTWQVMWLYSSGHTETRTSYSIRGVCDEPAYDAEISRRLQGTRGETGRGVGSTHCPDRA